MSALFKLVLGQKVVHPNTSNRQADAAAQEQGDASVGGASAATATPAGPVGKSSSSPPAVVSNRANGARAPPSVERSTASPHVYEGKSSPASGTASRGSAADAVGVRSPASGPGQQATHAPRPTTPTRTLLLRIEGCTVTQDLRDALRDLLRCPDLPYALDEVSLRSLLSLLTTYSEDESITEATLQLLANVTNIDVYPSQLESNRRTVEVTAADKRHTRDELLQGLMESLAVLLDSMGAAAPFWSRYYAVVLLQRLEDFDASKVNQALLAARGVGAILEALNESDHDNALRNEALQLLTSLSLADRELQTLLAFDNAFDSLFDLVQREGGVMEGGAVVRDSLTVVLNLLRSNKATQKFFREMGCAARLAALFDSIPNALASCTTANPRQHNPAAAAALHPQPTVLAEKLESLLEHAKSSDVALNVLMSVSILACVLRGYEEADVEDFHATQDSLLRCGLLNPLTRLAFCGLAIDDATRIEAVRVLALLLDRSKRALEEWLSAPPLTTLVRATLPYTVRVWPAPRALLSYVCETPDTTLVNAGVQLLLAVLSVPAMQECAAGVFLAGLVSSGAGGASTTTPSTAYTKVAAHSGSSSGAQGDPQCGAALARILLSPATSAVEKYYAAQVLRTLTSLPAAAKLSDSLVRYAVPTELQQGRLEALVRVQPGWTLSTHLPPSFFNYFASFLLFAISGGAASNQVNTAALGAYVAALLGWMSGCPWAAAALVEEVAWGDLLLHQARRDGAANLRLWAAMLIAKGCEVVHAAASASRESGAAAAGTALMQRFVQVVGGGAALDTILFDAQASTPAWQHPVASGLRTQTPTPYDEPFVAQVELLVVDFKRLLSTVAKPSSNLSAPVSLPPLTHLTSPLPPPPYASAAAESAAPSLAFPTDLRLSSPPASTGQAPSPSGSAVFSGQPSASIHGAGAPAEIQALVSSLQAQLQAAEAERERLIAAVEEWRGRAEQSESQCASLRKAHEELTAALASAEAQLAQHRTATTAEQAATVSADVVESLQENIHLLEEALRSKDEEQQQLVGSLNMLEEQLRHATRAAAAANGERAAAVAAAAAHHQSSPPPPPLPQGPPPEVVAAMAAERDELLHRLDAAQQESGHLQHSLHAVTAELRELLVMVAELNEECTTVKAASSMAPTPARQLAGWHMGSPSIERDYEPATAAPALTAWTAPPPLPQQEAPPVSSSASLPSPAHSLESSLPAAEDVQRGHTENTTPHLTAMARAASAYEHAAAKDTLIDVVAASQPSPSLPVRHAVPPSVSSRVSSLHGSVHHGAASPSVVLSTPPTSPPSYPHPMQPHKHGGLPNPLQARQAGGAHTPARHVPLYADPSGSLFQRGTKQLALAAAAAAPPPPPSPQQPPQQTWISPPQSATQSPPPSYHASAPPPAPEPFEQPWGRDQESERQPLESQDHFLQQGFVAGEASGAAPQLPSLPPSVADEERQGEAFSAPPLPSADDFFGVEDDGVAPTELGHESPTMATAAALMVPEATPQPRSYEEEETSASHGVAANPFLSPRDCREAQHPGSNETAAPTSSATVMNGLHAPSSTLAGEVNTPTGTTSPKRGDHKDVQSVHPVLGDAPHAAAPPPPPTPSTYRHPASALAGNAHHLNYRGSVAPPPPPQYQQHEHPIHSTAPPPPPLPAPPPAQNDNVMYAMPAESPPAAGEPHPGGPSSAAAYNPFADFRDGGDDGDDEFADLR